MTTIINNIKNKLAGTKMYKAYEWIKFTRQIGLGKKNSNPSSSKAKQLFIETVAKKYNMGTFVETGTYLGNMVFANLKNFKKIYSIELDRKLYERARNRFKNYSHVKIIHGDSSQVLEKLANTFKERVLFWLDAHYSGGITAMGKNNTPIEKELKIILNKWKNGSVILIDDARLFTGINEYPKIADIRNLAEKRALKLKIFRDIIIILLK